MPCTKRVRGFWKHTLISVILIIPRHIFSRCSGKLARSLLQGFITFYRYLDGLKWSGIVASYVRRTYYPEKSGIETHNLFRFPALERSRSFVGLNGPPPFSWRARPATSAHCYYCCRFLVTYSYLLCSILLYTDSSS
jgi:hypothetical protein